MKTSKQDIQDLLSQLAADIEEIKAILNGNGSAAGPGVGTSVAADVGASGKDNAISNDVAVGNSSTTANLDRIIAELNRLLEPIAQTCSKLPGRLKSYHVQLWKHIVSDIREELNSENATLKRKGSPTVEGKIDNSLTMLVSIYDRLDQLEDAVMLDALRQGQTGQTQSANGKSAHGKSAKSGIISVIKSAWSRVYRFLSKRPARWYRNPYILCAVVIYFLYFGLSVFSWQQWHHYRDENARLRLTADKYRVDSVILREVYPQAAITISAYEHITESEGADAAIEAFREEINAVNSKFQ